MTNLQIYYRLVDSFDGQNRPTISCIRFKVIRRTNKGAWVVPLVWYSETPPERFVLDGDGKRFAYPTFEAARQNYERRKARHIKLLRLQLERAVERAEIATVLTEHMTSNVYLQRPQGQPPSLGLIPKHDNPIVPVAWQHP